MKQSCFGFELHRINLICGNSLFKKLVVKAGKVPLKVVSTDKMHFVFHILHILWSILACAWSCRVYIWVAMKGWQNVISSRQEFFDDVLCNKSRASCWLLVIMQDANVDGNILQTKLRLTIPREPELQTAQRAQRMRYVWHTSVAMRGDILQQTK